MTPLKVAIVGAECTGKTALCEALAAALPGLCVPEYLREFVDRERRVPVASDQAAIFAEQIEREAAAMKTAARTGKRWVVCDSAPIVTAIYSEMYFADTGLHASATRHHAGYVLTLLTDTDLPWEPDGLQRDGPRVREASHARIERWLRAQDFPFAVTRGFAEQRTASALAALRAIKFPAR